MQQFLAGLNAKRRLRLRITLMASVEYLATCAFLSAYWYLGKAQPGMVLGFLAYSVIANSLIIGAIGSGWSERLADPSMTATQMAISCARDILGCFFMPGLWFVFVFNLFVALPFGSLQFSNRAFAWFWLMTCAALSAVFMTFPQRLQIGFDSFDERFVLWLFLSAALARLMFFNARISALRRKLRANAVALDQASRRLERERISRDLHDTLLQGMYGLVWRITGLSEKLPKDDLLRAQFDAALQIADAALQEARDQILGLRESTVEARTLWKSLKACGDELSRESQIIFHSELEKRLPTQTDLVQANLERIIREALMNAFRHSQGKNVWLYLGLEAHVIFARVWDDGVGIASEVVRAGLPGHFGLAIMKERAATIGATLDISQRSERGTLVVLQLPCR